MFKIGTFSKLSDVSIKTLRYYDQRDILKPSMIDETSSYRFYASSQLLTIRRIQAWKDQGFTLEQIKTLLQEDILPEKVVKSLKEKQEELQLAIDEMHLQLNEISKRIDHVEHHEMEKVNPTPVFKKRNSILVASIREVIPQSSFCLLLDEVKKYVKSHGEDENNSLIVQWYNSSSRKEEEKLDLEVAIPITNRISDSKRIKVYHLPKEEKVVSLTHECNPYHIACDAQNHLLTYIQSNKLKVNPDHPIREHYLFGDKEVYGSTRKAELSIPIL
ncbi:MerR family transcriptional regulator [Shimazuella kribbensis]|uniref:MerR family transcriptional regulator n=1 Tax=Shimazuella kribbensis TaxID=139808 RepID=UPI0003F4DE64|nr:MerR family transcriptional regulator [Shimazuella kribbensis]